GVSGCQLYRRRWLIGRVCASLWQPLPLQLSLFWRYVLPHFRTLFAVFACQSNLYFLSWQCFYVDTEKKEVDLTLPNENCFWQDFLLKYKNRTEQDEIETRENLNRLLLENVLPAHVAAIFVSENKKNEDRERQQAQIGIMVEFAIAMMGKLDGINRHSFNSFRLRVGSSGGTVMPMAFLMP
ncbi:hypothetical protein GOODEAATRI_002112, partial [Goodea atripinnis]